MKQFYLVDYKGKHFIIQDELEDSMDELAFPKETITEDEITDKFLIRHVSFCIYFGIPAYLGKDKKLKVRIKRLEKSMLGC